MKKVFFAIAIVAAFAACNNSATKDAAKDTTAVKVDTTAAAKVDTTAKVAVDSTKKAVVADSTKK